MINATKQWLPFIFEMKDMGEAGCVLGMEIIRNYLKRLIGICQEAYIKRVLQHFLMHYSKPVDTPVNKCLTLNLGQCPKID